MAVENKKMQQRRDTAANWTSIDPVLTAGEFGFETDTYKLKIGDGTTIWSSLPYLGLGGGGGGDLLSTNNLSDLTNFATARTNLGVEIGADVQAWSAVLDDVSATLIVETNAYAVRESINAPIQFTLDNSGSGASSESIFSAQSDSSRLDVRCLSGNYTVTGDLVVGDCVLEGTSRLFLAGGSSIIFADNVYDEKARITEGLMVGTTTDPGAGIINVATGFRIANAATNNNFLVGNGTNFVSTAPASARAAIGAVGLTGNESIAGDKTFSGIISGTILSLTSHILIDAAAVHSMIESEDVTLGQAAKSFLHLRDNETNEWHAWPNEFRLDAIRTRIGDWQSNGGSNFIDIDSDGAGSPYFHIVSGGNPVVIGDIGAVGNGTTLTVDDAGQAIVINVPITFPDDIRQTFNPGTTNAGLNVGSIAGDPSAPSNGDLWYDSTANELTARINGANVALGAGGGGSIDGSGSSGVLAGWVDSDTLEAVAGLTSPSGHALMIQAQAAGDVGLSVRGNTSDDDNILELRRGSNDAVNVWWGPFGDMTVSDRFITLQSGGETRGGWHPSQGGWMVAPGFAYCFTNANNFNTIDAKFERDAAGVIEINDGSTGGAAFQWLEQTAPAAGPANSVRFYAEDNGSGKTRVMAKFSDGSTAQVVIQP